MPCIRLSKPGLLRGRGTGARRTSENAYLPRTRVNRGAGEDRDPSVGTIRLRLSMSSSTAGFTS
jgi:hypothetical protein